MRRLAAFLVPVAGLCLLCSCATTIPVAVTKPAEINMAGNRVVAVLDFRYPEEAGLSAGDLFRWAITRLTGIETYRHKSVEQRVAEYATTQVITTLLDTGHFQLVSPRQVASVMQGRIDAWTSPIDVGRAVGAQAIITGELFQLDSDEERWLEDTVRVDPDTGEETEVYTRWTGRKVEVGMSYQVVNTGSGRVVASRSFRGADEAEQPEVRRVWLPSAEDMYKSVIDTFMPVLARQLAPYTVRERRSLMRDRSRDPRVEQGQELARARLYEEALQVFLQAWRESGNVAAGYDAAILYEALGRLEEAIAQMQEVARATGDRRALDAVRRLQAARQERQRVLEQRQ